jgi:hypothetical protein
MDRLLTARADIFFINSDPVSHIIWANTNDKSISLIRIKGVVEDARHSKAMQ